MSGPIILKTKDEIARMRTSGRILARIMREVSKVVRPGIRTSEINDAAINAMEQNGAKSSFLGYSPWGKTPYPAVICVSVEKQVVHGLPGRRKLAEGEIVSLDCGVHVDGFHADMAVTLPVGEISPEKTRLIETCRSALWAGLRAIRPGVVLSDVARAIQAASGSYGIVSGYGGHGIGRALHESPFVPNRIDQEFEDVLLNSGLVLALEPMLNLRGASTKEDRDGWTVVTSDGSPSAHWEHTVAVTDDGFEVLTVDEPFYFPNTK